METDRYEGKPFLRLLDCYVLDAIGCLPSHQQDALRQFEPKLRDVYSRSGTWQETVRAEMDLPETFPESIRKMWQGFSEAAASQKLPAVPEEFALRFVDENFPEVRTW